MAERKATSFEIAHLAGVSQSTVSRALRNSPLVSEETRERVQRIAKELNYTVDRMASSLRSGSTNTIALLLFEDPDSDESMINPFFSSMLGSITHASGQLGYDLLVSFQQLSSDWHTHYQEAHRADGLILLGYGDYNTSRPKLDRLAEVGAKFVLWGPVTPEQPGSSVGCDNRKGGYLAGKHLLSLGRRKLALVGDVGASFPELDARYRGFCVALEEAGIDPYKIPRIAAENSDHAGNRAIDVLRSQQPDCDAIFCVSDIIAFGAMRGLLRNGRRIPDDVSVMGFDDISAAAYANPALSTMRQDARKAGEMMVQLLLETIRGEAPTSQLLDPTLVIRESCGAAKRASAKSD